jgi:serine/threonine protein kinase
MGVVYHGFDPVIGRGVAVKTLRLSEAGTGLTREELVGRFQTEARAAGLLTHPNIVVVYDAGEEDGLFYITMEFVEGRSLQSLIDSKQTFPVSRIMRLMEQVCSALDFAHQHNVVHRDIKPANLMLTADDTVKITDFGTAKILQFGTAQTTHVMGTPSYMSPEQVKGKPVDGRSDIFSLGVILYELMTGEKPFPGQNITTVIYKIINEEPIPPRAIDSSIHPGLSAVISRALAKDPNARYQSCHELLTALKNFHEMVGPDATVRIPHAASQPAPGANRSAAQPQRTAAAPMTTRPAEGRDPLHAPMLLVTPEETHEGRGRFLLVVALLGIIGYAGYRVYAPGMDLWRRAHEAVETRANSAKADSSLQTSSSENSTGSPEQQTADASPNAEPERTAPSATATPIENRSQKDTSRPKVVPAVTGKSSEPALTTASTMEAPSAPEKAPVPPAPPAAHLLELKLRDELAGQPLANKVTIQSAGKNLTLSGSLTPAEHRDLLQHLRAVPSGVRVIDDIEYAEDLNSAPAATSTGWIWVRSSPPGARILVDGSETGLRTPARLELQAGQHEVRLVRRGFSTTQRNVTVDSGHTIQFTDSLPPE